MSEAKPGAPVVELQNVVKLYPLRGRRVHAVNGVSLEIGVAETLGIVGESGSGKSTLGRIALRLVSPTSGKVFYSGRDVTQLRGRRLRESRRAVQTVFQDPHSSFAPFGTIASSVAEPLETVRPRPTRTEVHVRLRELVEMVGLHPDHLQRHPSELSGGQLQRMAIARALAANPRLIVLDEPVSSLDVSTQAQVINLLEALQSDLQMSYILISHSPALVRHASERIAVMYLGEVVEVGEAGTVYDRPKHPYTAALRSAVLVPDPSVGRLRKRIPLAGEIPNPSDMPTGCYFHTRCAYAMDICRQTAPEPFVAQDGSTVRCHLHVTGPKLQGESILTMQSSAL
jgi:oligopeptide/dipeptide ABC transporter ATP-binding protein